MKTYTLRNSIFWAIAAFVVIPCIATTLMVLQGNKVEKSTVGVFAISGGVVGIYFILRFFAVSWFKKKQ